MKLLNIDGSLSDPTNPDRDTKAKQRSDAHLLIIDDCPETRDMLKETLSPVGYKVICEANGKDVLTLLRAHPVDLVITDILMPEKEGIETIQELHSHHPDLRIIAISGAPDDWNVLRMAEKLGAQASLPKPFRSAEIIEAVDQLLKASVKRGLVGHSCSQK